MQKKLYRSEKNKILAGICGGVGECFNIDPTIVRVGYLLITVFTGIIPGVIVYIVLIFVIPERHESETWREGDTDGPPHRPWS